METSSYPWPALCRTFLLWFSFFSTGISNSVRGPTLLDLRDLISVETSEISTTFALRSLGGLFGSLATGLLLDRLSRASRYLTLAICFTVAGFCTVLLPHAPSLVLMQVICFFFFGIHNFTRFAADLFLVWILQRDHPHRLQCSADGHLVRPQLLPIHVSSPTSNSPSIKASQVHVAFYVCLWRHCRSSGSSTISQASRWTKKKKPKWSGMMWRLRLMPVGNCGKSEASTQWSAWPALSSRRGISSAGY